MTCTFVFRVTLNYNNCGEKVFVFADIAAVLAPGLIIINTVDDYAFRGSNHNTMNTYSKVQKMN